MNSSRLGLVLATSFGLLQYNCLPTLSQSQNAGVQKKHGANSSIPDKSKAVTLGLASDEHVLLFFANKNKDGRVGSSPAPAAALTIHPVLPLSPQIAQGEPAKTVKPTLIAMNGHGDVPLDLRADNASACNATGATTSDAPASVFDSNVIASNAGGLNSANIEVQNSSASPAVYSTISASDSTSLAPAAKSAPPVEKAAAFPASKAEEGLPVASLPAENSIPATNDINAEPSIPEPMPIVGVPHNTTDVGSASDTILPKVNTPTQVAHAPEVIAAAKVNTPTQVPAVISKPSALEPVATAITPTDKTEIASGEVAASAVPQIADNEVPASAPIFMSPAASGEATAKEPLPVPIASLPTADLSVHNSNSTSKDSPLTKRFSPDQLIAQSDNTSTTSSPIPPVVSGTVDLEEFKSSNVLDLKVSQSRTFRLRNKIVRTSISDPAIADPIVVSENQLILLGKAPGGATLVIWDDAGNSLAVDVKVVRDFTTLQATLRDIDPRIIVKAFSVGGSDRVILMGDVDHAESVIRAFSTANAFMDDRGMKILAANSRLLDGKIGEQLQSGAAAGASGSSGQGSLGALQQVDKYVYTSNLTNNVAKAQTIISDGGRVTSLIKVRKTPLIVLHCQFLEMNSVAVRELGMQLGMNLTTTNFAFGIGGQNGTISSTNGGGSLLSFPGANGLVNGVSGPTPSNANVVAPVSFVSPSTLNLPLTPGGTPTPIPISGVGLGVLSAAPALATQTALFGAPASANFPSGGAGLANLLSGVSNLTRNSHYRFSLNPTINGIITQSRARILAEPTLVTISGERAAFLAGGEIPIVQALATAGASQQSVVFEPFGLRLNMIPVLLENGVINLEISPEERLLSIANGINLVNVGSIPGFTTRKLQTVVELKPGQELFISGMVSANSGRELDKTPILGEVPVLGALYKSKAFNKNESELVVSVRPEIIIPGNPGQLKLPEEISRTEGVRDTNIFQVEPTVIDERYMTSGRAEHSQNVPGTLPAGSPIPDSQ